jgi:hypothetical protein
VSKVRTVILALAVLLVPFSVQAGSNFTGSESVWKASDKCNSRAITKFPDHTSEALAKREAFVRQCNRDSRVPARAPFTETPQPNVGVQ